MRITKQKLQDENDLLKNKLREAEARISDLRQAHSKEIQARDERDRDIRYQLTSVLTAADHGRFTMESRKNRPLDNRTDYNMSCRPFSWEEIFFSIGGLHATSEYAIMAQEVRRLNVELQEARAKKADQR